MHSSLIDTCLLGIFRVLLCANDPFLARFLLWNNFPLPKLSSKKVPPRGPKTLLKELEKLTADKAFLQRNPEVHTCRDWGSDDSRWAVKSTDAFTGGPISYGYHDNMSVVKAIVRPHGSRFSGHRPEPTSRVFRSMRPFSKLLLFSAFFMVFANGISGLAEESNGLAESPARDKSSFRNVNWNRN